MQFDILTLFPELFSPLLKEGILGRAVKGGLVDVRLTDIRAFAEGPHRVIDDRPYGGGNGMVMKPDSIYRALESIERIDEAPLLSFSPPRVRSLNSPWPGSCPDGISLFLFVGDMRVWMNG